MRLEDAGIIGAGHETLHQRCGLAINEEDLDQRGVLAWVVDEAKVVAEYEFFI